MKMRCLLAVGLLSGLLLGCAATYESAEEKYQDGEVSEAREQWTELAEQGDTRAMYRLFDTAAPKKSPDWEWLDKAARLDHPQAKYEWGIHQIDEEQYTAGIKTLNQAKDLGVAAASDWLSKHSQEITWWPDAEHGSTDAMVSLGQYYKGQSAYHLALKWFERAAERKSASAYFYMGVMYSFGYGVPANAQKAAEWYQKSANEGHPTALFNLCIMTRDGEGVRQDLTKARSLCWQAHQKGEIEGTSEYGHMLLWGIGGEKNPTLAKELLEPIVNDNEFAAVDVANIYFSGIDTDVDYKRAFELYAKAHNANDKFSFPAYRIATMYDQGLGREKNAKEAFHWFEVAAQRGDVYSQRRVALFYYDGEVVAKNRAIAAQWFEKSAEGKDDIAAYYIGIAYLNGDGVKANYAKAKQYLTQSAQAGYKDAQFSLGYEYSEGSKFGKDNKQFFAWTQKSAYQNHSVAQFNLSIAYENGWGVDKNYAWAAYWRAKSAAQNYSSASDTMDSLLRKLDKLTVEKSSYIFSDTNSTSNKVVKVNKGDVVYSLGKQGKWTEVVSAVGYQLGYVMTENVTNHVRKSAAVASSPFPARPTKISGQVSCNTRCVNSTCWRTYDDGRQVKFQAQSKFNPFTGQFEWDSGNCVN